MRSLSATLLAAQQSATFRPAVRCQLRPMSGMADRYQLAPYLTLTTLPANCVTAALYTGGVLYVYALDLTSFAISVRLVSGLGETPAVVLGTAAGSPNLLAVCITLGGGVAIVTAKSGTLSPAVNLYQLAAPDAALPTPTGIGQLATGWVLTGIAVTQATDGRIAVAACGRTSTPQYGVAVLAQPSNGAAFPAGPSTKLDANAAGLNAVGIVHTTDWLLAATGSWDAGLNELGLYVYGDGVQEPGGTWSPVQIVLAVNANGPSTVGTALTLGGVVASDVLRLFVGETFSNNAPGVGTAYSFSRGYQVVVPDAVGWKNGVAREPQALPNATSDIPKPAYDVINGGLYCLAGTAVYKAAQPTTLDLSSRVLRVQRTDVEHGGKTSVVLDDSDGGVTNLGLDPETVGQRLTVDFGYVTAAGAEYASYPPLWVSAASVVWDGERRTVELVAMDGCALLAAWRPRRSYTWIAGVSTIGAIVGWLCGKAGLNYTPPAALSTLAQAQPAYMVRGGTDGLRAVMDLLGRVPECLALSQNGATLVQPLTVTSPVYTYGSNGQHAVVSARGTVHGQGVNHVVVLGSAESATYPSALAEAQDAADQYREGPQAQLERDMQLAGSTTALRVASGQARAAAVLAKAQLIQDAGEIVTAPNVGLEVWDRVAVSCPALGWSGTQFYVREIVTEYQVDGKGGVYSQAVGLMPVGGGVRS